MQLDFVGRLTAGTLPAHDAIAAGERWWTQWQLDLELLVPVLLLGVLYVRGLHRWHDRSRPHPWWQTASYFCGLAIVVLSQASPLGSLSHHHFSMHMIQHELTIMLAAPLILLGAPTTPVLRGLPRAVRHRIVRPLARSRIVYGVFRTITHPLVAAAFFISVLWAWHLAPGWYNTALTNEPIHDIQHASFMAAGLLFWWNIIDPAPRRSRMSYLLRMAFLFAISTPKHFLGAIIVFADRELFTGYQNTRLIFEIERMNDQALGGLIMWVPSQMMMLVSIGIVFAVWAHKSELRQRALDQQLSAEQHQAAS